MKARVVGKNWDSIKCDALIVPLPEDDGPTEPRFAQWSQEVSSLLAELRESREWRGERGEVMVLYRPRGLDVERLVFTGLGPLESADYGSLRGSILRAIKRLKRSQIGRLAIVPPSWLDGERSLRSAIEGVVLAEFDPGRYKTEEPNRARIGEVVVLTELSTGSASAQESLQLGRVLAEATNLARALTNEPGNRVNPVSFVERAIEIAAECGLDIEVLGEVEMAEKGMNAILAVAAGSEHPPRFIVLKHLGASDSSAPPMVFVGKGVTFDSGGLSLKPAQSMEEMKTDKAGACSVLAALWAVAKLQLPRNVIALLPLVENLPGGKAQRPGDVISSLSGKTIEVVNTDAEGRLILADALSYACAEFNPQFIIDIATLTGACVVALGHFRAGLFSNSDSLCQQLLKAADRCGERFWRLPLDPEYRKEIESQIADVKNVGSRWGGAIVAAKFLQEFVGKTPWCHLDIAGVDLFHEKPDLEGPTGFGVRTLVEMVLAESLPPDSRQP